MNLVKGLKFKHKSYKTLFTIVKISEGWVFIIWDTQRTPVTHCTVEQARGYFASGTWVVVQKPTMILIGKHDD